MSETKDYLDSALKKLESAKYQTLNPKVERAIAKIILDLEELIEDIDILMYDYK